MSKIFKWDSMPSKVLIGSKLVKVIEPLNHGLTDTKTDSSYLWDYLFKLESMGVMSPKHTNAIMQLFHLQCMSNVNNPATNSVLIHQGVLVLLGRNTAYKVLRKCGYRAKGIYWDEMIGVAYDGKTHMFPLADKNTINRKMYSNGIISKRVYFANILTDCQHILWLSDKKMFVHNESQTIERMNNLGWIWLGNIWEIKLPANHNDNYPNL